MAWHRPLMLKETTIFSALAACGARLRSSLHTGHTPANRQQPHHSMYTEASWISLCGASAGDEVCTQRAGSGAGQAEQLDPQESLWCCVRLAAIGNAPVSLWQCLRREQAAASAQSSKAVCKLAPSGLTATEQESRSLACPRCGAEDWVISANLREGRSVRALGLLSCCTQSLPPL